MNWNWADRWYEVTTLVSRFFLIQNLCLAIHSNLHPFNPRFKSTSNLHPFNRDAKALQLQEDKNSFAYLLTYEQCKLRFFFVVFVCLLVYVRMWCVWCVLLCILFWMEQPHSLEFGSDFFLLFMDPWFGVLVSTVGKKKKVRAPAGK